MKISAKKRKTFPYGQIILDFLLFLLAVLMLFPVINVFSKSFSSEEHLLLNDIVFFPKGFTFASYKLLLQSNDIWVAYKNTIVYTLVGTLISMVCTLTLSYAVSQKNFGARRVVIWYVMITMFFSGGTIPVYILMINLRLIDTMWAIVLPGAVSAFNMIITRTYFATISSSVFEAASIDGASEFRKFLIIAVPLAKPIIAVLCLYQVVAFWNTYFSAVLYLDSISKQPLQNYLEKILSSSDAGGGSGVGTGIGSITKIEQLKYSSIVVTMVPIMCLYPFLQKYFVQGIMVGSIKE